MKKIIIRQKGIRNIMLLCSFVSLLSLSSYSQISRTQIINNAIPYTNFSWTSSSCNHWNGTSCGGRNVYHAPWVVIGSNVSMPYMWGGWSTTSQHMTAMANCKSAGDVCSISGGGCSGNGSGLNQECASGHDCSGLVSRAWALSSKYSTSTLPNISTSIALSQTQGGDILNIAGSHVRLVETNYANGYYQVIESSGADWKVAYHSYSAAQLASYDPRCPNPSIVIGGCGITAPINDNCNGAVQFPTLQPGNYVSATSGKTVLNATQSLTPNTCTGCNCLSPTAMDVWFKFTAINTSHTIQLSSLVGFDAVIEIRQGPSCNGAYLECYDPVGSPSSYNYTYNNFIVGQTYYIRVFDYGNTPPTVPTFEIGINTPSTTLPDFVVLSVSGPATATPGSIVNVTIQAKNQSANPTQSGTYVGLRMILSADQSINLGDVNYFDIDIPISSFQNNAVVTQTFSYLIPSNLSGTYYWGGYMDSYTYWIESNENNNAALGNSVNIQTLPDFVVLSVSGPTTATPGSIVNVTIQAKNQSGNPIQSGTYVGLRLILSADQSINLGDVNYLDIDIPIPSFQNNTVVTQTFSYLIPSNLSGTYYWGGYIDSYTYWIESNENNNAALGNSLSLQSYPDLIISAGSQSVTPSVVAAGSNITAYASEDNIGTAASGINVVGLWLSSDNILNTEIDVYLGEITGYPSLSPGSNSAILNTSVNIPSSITPGAYYLFFWADGNQIITELIESNNFASISLTITCTLPGSATITGPNSGCASTSLTFSVNASNATSYNWTAPSDWSPNTGTGSGFTSTPGSSGNITVTPTNSCGNGTPGSSYVTVSALPGSATITGPNSGCAGTSLTFSANASNATSYNWSAPTDWSPNTGTGSGFTSTPGSSGNIAVTPTNSCGNGVTEIQLITITALPGTVTITGSDEGCSVPLTFYASSSNAISFNWIAPADWVPSIGSGSNFTTTPGSSGNICATPYNNCGSGTQGCKNFTLNSGTGTPPNQPGPISGSENPISGEFQNYSISTVLNADAYSWTIPSDWTLNSGQGTNNIIVTVGENSGNICVSAVNYCGASPQECSLVNVIVSTPENSFIKNLNIYPNPNHGEFNLQIEVIEPINLEIELLTVIGQTVFFSEKSLNAGIYQFPVKFSQQPNGYYILKIKGERGTKMMRVIKE